MLSASYESFCGFAWHNRPQQHHTQVKLICNRKYCNSPQIGCLLVSRQVQRFCKADDIDEELKQFIQAKQKDDQKDCQPGAVYLVGTGPGDPGLITLRALQLLQSADVVLYDRLVTSDILSLICSEAVMVYVGKRQGFHTRKQEDIHRLMGQFAAHGALVVRLKGGDPYIFGRGGEELLYLRKQGIPTYCVPGITAASGICAELGIPLTHRGVATSVRYLTGHSRDGDEETLAHTTALSGDPHTTLVVYMGLKTFPTLSSELQAAGLSPDTPAAAIERGTTPAQRAVYGTLSELPRKAQAVGLQSPTLIIIGEVVALCEGYQRMAAGGGMVDRGLAGPGLVEGVVGEFGVVVKGALEDAEAAIGRGAVGGEDGETGEYIL